MSRNLLLRTLSDEALDSADLQPVQLERGQSLTEYGRPLTFVYFPTTSVVSRCHFAGSGHTAEMGMVGFEGVVGVTAFLGAQTAANDTIVHIGGAAFRLEKSTAERLFQEERRFQESVLHYIRAMIRQVSLVAACNSLHSIEHRVCRWLLLTQSRAQTDEFEITHDFIAQLLSVRRPSITSTMHKLSQAKLIINGRCCLRVLDRSGLQAAACECYAMISNEYPDLIRGDSTAAKEREP